MLGEKFLRQGRKETAHTRNGKKRANKDGVGGGTSASRSILAVEPLLGIQLTLFPLLLDT